MENKYNEIKYVDSGFYSNDRDDENSHLTEKVVKCRKSHTCSYCGKEIKIGDNALCETGIHCDEGRWSNYLCLTCIEEWLEKSGQVETE